MFYRKTSLYKLVLLTVTVFLFSCGEDKSDTESNVVNTEKEETTNNNEPNLIPTNLNNILDCETTWKNVYTLYSQSKSVIYDLIMKDPDTGTNINFLKTEMVPVSISDSLISYQTKEGNVPFSFSKTSVLEQCTRNIISQELYDQGIDDMTFTYGNALINGKTIPTISNTITITKENISILSEDAKSKLLSAIKTYCQRLPGVGEITTLNLGLIESIQDTTDLDRDTLGAVYGAINMPIKYKTSPESALNSYTCSFIMKFY